MSRNTEGHGVVTDDKGQEQPNDKDRAQTAQQTPRRHASRRPDKDDDMQPTREKSGF